MTEFPSGPQAPGSPLARMDSLAKFCSVLATVLAIAAYPADAGWRYGAVLATLAGLWLAARLPVRYLGRRLLAGTPFIAMAAALPLASGIPDAGSLALAILAKAYAAILLLSMLTATTPVEGIVGSMTRLGAPRGIALVATLMHRYLFVLLGEWRRIARARDCRAGGRVARARIRVWASHAAVVFLRGWERAERVSHAMLARGFRGELPRRPPARPGLGDLALGLVPPLAALALRLA